MCDKQSKAAILAIVLVALYSVLSIVTVNSTQAETIGSGQIKIVGLVVDVDTRPDIDGIQSTRKAVKDFPSAVLAVVGSPDGSNTVTNIPADSLVVAELDGPGLGNKTLTLSARPNTFLEIPALRVSGDYVISNVRLEREGGVILERLQGPDTEPIVINVIDEILVTEVTSRPLSLDEIREKGIIITEDNFTALEFVVGFVVESKTVKIEIPVIIPSEKKMQAIDIPQPKIPKFAPQIQEVKVPGLEIPNLMVAGFGLMTPPLAQEDEKDDPPATIPGVIIIPGDVGFLNEFFSVLIMVSNASPQGSSLLVSNLKSAFKLPPGEDQIPGTGDDPLRLAETQQGGVQSILPILRITETATGEKIVSEDKDSLRGGETGQAEFLPEGLIEGTHVFDIDVTGKLEGFRSGNSYDVATTVPGSVLVRNPKFAMTVAHPRTVRRDEPYTVYVTMSNISKSDANLVSLSINRHSLSGTLLAEGEEEVKNVETIKAGSSETVLFRMVSQITGEVGATVFLSDEGINGRFVLTVGVSEDGIPLSPDTLIIPETADHLPEELIRSAMRLLGQAYSVATAPGGSLPAGITRMSKDIVFERALNLARGGMRIKFKDSEKLVIHDLLFDYLGAGINEPEPGASKRDIEAFDLLRREVAPGPIVADTFAALMVKDVANNDIIAFQNGLAETERYRSPHLSVAVNSGSDPAPVRIQITDSEGKRLGILSEDEEVRREIPFAEIYAMSQLDDADDNFAVVTVPDATQYTIDILGIQSGSFDLGVIVPEGETGQRSLLYEGVSITEGIKGTLNINTTENNDFLLNLDTDGDGTPEEISPSRNRLIPDDGPALLVANHWGEGDYPWQPPKLKNGDPLGRMVVALFSEPVDKESAMDITNYRIDDDRIGIGSIGLQPGGRILMLFLDEPIRPPPAQAHNSPFIERTLTVSNMADLRGNTMDPLQQSFTILPDPEIGDGGVLSGTVRHADGSPVPFAIVNYIQPVCMFPVCPARPITSQIFANDRGEYSIDFVLKNALGPFTIEAQDPETGYTGRVRTSVQFDGQRFILDVIIPGFGSVEGVVHDSNGGPVPGAIVNVNSLTTGLQHGGKGGAVADHNGYYRVDQIAVGNIGIVAHNPADGANGRAAGNIAAVGSTANVDVTVFATGRGSLRARVLSSDGEQVEGVAVVLRTGGKAIALQESDVTGQVNFEELTIGSYSLEAINLVTGEKTRVVAFVEENGVKDVNLVLPGVGGTVKGIIVDKDGKPVAGAQVIAGQFLTETDENGTFEITGLVVGNVEIKAGANSSKNTITVTLSSETDLQEVTLKLPPPADFVSVFGTVFKADRTTPVPNTPVYFIAGGLAITDTDEDGNYRFDDLPVQTPIKATVRSTRGTSDGGENRTTFSFDGETQRVDVIYRGTGSIKGRVIQAQGGTPVIADVKITKSVIKILEGGGGIGIASTEVRKVLEGTGFEDGELVRMPIFTSEEVEIKSDEFIQITGPDGKPAQELTGGFTLNNVLAGPFGVSTSNPFLGSVAVSSFIPKTPNPEERIIDVGDLVLETSTGSVEGFVFLPDGNTPVGENVSLTIKATGLPEFSVITDEDGHYEFPLVPKGAFTIRADTGVPLTRAQSGAEIITDGFDDLNVRLFGEVRGFIKSGGDQVDANLRLLDSGSIKVTVVENNGVDVVPFAKVTLSTTSLLDQDEFVNFNTDDQGEIELFPVIEGDFTVKANNPNTAAVGLASNTIPEDPSNGFRLPVKVQLGAVSDRQTVDEVLGFGTVAGTIFRQAGISLTTPAEVLLVVKNRTSLNTISDTRGNFTFESIPVNAPFKIQVFEPFTARRGSNIGQLTADGQTEVVEILLEGLGTVVGTVSSFDGIPQSGATVRLRPAGNFSGDIITQTDVNGSFSFPGVPRGVFTVTATSNSPINILTGAVTGNISFDEEVVRADVFLEAAGVVQGTVYENNSQDPVKNAIVTLKRGNDKKSEQTDDDGFYRFSSVAAGDFTLTARPPIGNDGGIQHVTLSLDKIISGEAEKVDIIFEGTGEVKGRIVDSQGLNAVNNALVTLSSLSPFLKLPVIRSVEDSEGRFSFTIPTGDFRIGVVTTVQEPPLGTSFNGTVQANKVLDLGDVRLEESGLIKGCVVRADGVNAAPNAVIILTKAGRSALRLTTETDVNGCFEFRAIPLGDSDIALLDPVSTGQNSAQVTINQNGQIVDLGTITLDDDSPRVVSITPTDGESDVSPGTSVVVTLSEPVDPDTVNDKTFKVSTAAGEITGTIQTSTSPPAITFTPAKPIPALRLVTVSVVSEKVGFNGNITPGVKDMVGFTLLEDFESHFTINDSTPPETLSLSPQDTAVQVPIESVIRVKFDEAIDRDSIRSFTLNDGSSDIDGKLNTLPILNDTVIVFVPASRLEPNKTYTVTIQGPVKDRAANPQPQEITTWSFRTIDTIGPDINSLTSLGGTSIFVGEKTRITADPGDADDVAYVDFFVNGEHYKKVETRPYEIELVLTNRLGAEIRIEAKAVDTAGNISKGLTIVLNANPNLPPDIVITQPLDHSNVATGQQVNVVVRASDDVGVREVAYSATGAATANEVEVLEAPLITVDHTFHFTVPDTAAPGATINLRVSAKDTLQQNSQTVTRQLIVTDGAPPVVTVSNPLSGTLVDPGDTIVIQVMAEDRGKVSTIHADVSSGGTPIGSFTKDNIRTSKASTSFTFQIPNNASAGNNLIISAHAVDEDGNRGNSPPVVMVVRDNAAPVVSRLNTQNGLTSVGIGEGLDIVVDATDNVGIKRITLSSDKGTIVPETRDFATGNPSVSTTFTLSVPNDVSLIGSPIMLTAIAKDANDNLSAPVTLPVSVTDPMAPTVGIDKPADNSEVVPKQDVTVTVTAGDNVGITEIELKVTGAATFEETVTLDPITTISREFQFTVPEAAATNASINITATARDNAGNSKSSSITLRVADVIPPEFVSVDPPVGAVDVEPMPTIRITLNEALNPDTVNSNTVLFTADGGDTVSASISITNAGRTITIMPDNELTFNTRYRVVVTTDITDVAGNALEEQINTFFTTESPDQTSPQVLSVFPHDGATEVSVSTTIQIRFTEPVKTETVDSSSFALKAGGTEVTGELRFTNGNTGLIFTPDDALPFSTVITIQLTDRITDVWDNQLVDADGNPLAGPLIYTFTTGTFAITNPVNGDNVIENSELLLQARGSTSLGISTVTFTVNGQEFPPVPGPFYKTTFTVPTVIATSQLTITAAARNSRGDIIAQDQVVVHVVVGLRIRPKLLGIPVGGMGTLQLLLSSPLNEDLTVDLRAVNSNVVTLQNSVRITAGETELPVQVRGNSFDITNVLGNNTTIVASSNNGVDAAVISVSEPVSQQQLMVFAKPVGVVVNTLNSVGSIIIPESREQIISLKLLSTAATEDIRVTITSDNPDVARVDENVVIQSGETDAQFTIKTFVSGKAILKLQVGEEVRLLTVIVGTPSENRIPPVFARPVGIVVNTLNSLGSTIIPVGREQVISLKLLNTAATEETRVTITSDRSEVARVDGNVVIQSGETDAQFIIKTFVSGKAILRLQVGDEIRLLTVIVGSPSAGQIPPVLAPVVGLNVYAPQSLGLVFLRENSGYNLNVELLSSPAGVGGEVVTYTSDASEVAVISIGTELLITQGKTVTVLPIATGRAGRATLTLYAGGEAHELTVIVGAPQEGETPAVVAPIIGLEVNE
ncbi:MAG: Ig-like domain-containing protein [Candidatus Scalindua sp.]|nr:Ig-like domain-containing protein [Candidatus Scalindua sp.]